MRRFLIGIWVGWTLISGCRLGYGASAAGAGTPQGDGSTATLDSNVDGAPSADGAPSVDGSLPVDGGDSGTARQVDQEYNDPGFTNVAVYSANVAWQGFTVGKTGTLRTIELLAMRRSTASCTPTAALDVAIVTLSANVPTTTIRLQAQVPAASVGGNDSDSVVVNFANGLAVKPGDKYAIRAGSATSLACYYRWNNGANANGYARGDTWYSTDQGMTLTDSPNDFLFRTYVDP